MELFSPGHLIVLAIVVAVLFFGWKQLPDMSRSLGRSLRIFRTEIKGMSQDDAVRESTPPTAAAPAAAPVVPAVPAAPAQPAAAQPAPAPAPASAPVAGPQPEQPATGSEARTV